MVIPRVCSDLWLLLASQFVESFFALFCPQGDPIAVQVHGARVTRFESRKSDRSWGSPEECLRTTLL